MYYQKVLRFKIITSSNIYTDGIINFKSDQNLINLNEYKYKFLNMKTQENNFIQENSEVLKSLAKNFNNNFEFGEEIRKAFRTNELVTSLPNDRDLGEKIRLALLSI